MCGVALPTTLGSCHVQYTDIYCVHTPWAHIFFHMQHPPVTTAVQNGDDYDDYGADDDIDGDGDGW